MENVIDYATLFAPLMDEPKQEAKTSIVEGDKTTVKKSAQIEGNAELEKLIWMHLVTMIVNEDIQKVEQN